MDYICKYCNQSIESIRKLNAHESMCNLNPNLILDKEQYDFDDNLYQHYYYLYQDKMVEYRNNKVLEYKNLGYNRSNSLFLARIDTLKYIKSYDEKLQIADGTWACPICGLHLKDMGTHVVKSHKIGWDQFRAKYNWPDCKIYFSETYKDNLSKNKLNFYNNTEEGAQLKLVQSKKFTGNNNPACKDEVKLKISRSRLGQHISNKNKENISKSTTGGLYSENVKSFGYIFWAICNGKERRFRSKNEYLIFLMLEYYKINFEYEPYKIEYIDPEYGYPRHYIVDFTSNNRLFEVKPNKVDLSIDRKYIAVQNQLNKINKKLELLTPLNFTEVFSISVSEQKPLSFFNNLIIENIKNGNCKLQFPIVHELEFYINSKFIKSLGDNPKEILEKGELSYENKKNYRNN